MSIGDMIVVSELCKTYRSASLSVPVLRSVSLAIRTGEFVAIMGPSGSGKSTLLNVLGCLDRFDSGSLQIGRHRIHGQDDMAAASGAADTVLAGIRSESIGFVFQGFNLIPRMSALRNVELPMIYRGLERRQRRERAARLLGEVGLADRTDHLPTQLSGGQQQRVAIARALANEPALLIADEPTGSLDSRTSDDVLDVLEDLNRAGMTVVMVTHEPPVANRANRVIELRDGRVAA